MSNMIPWDTDSTSFNGVTRIRSSTFNFLTNADFESWNNGTSVVPPGWTASGGVTVAQASTLTTGSFSAQLTFSTAGTGVFYQAVGSSTAVDYTFTCYVKLVSGTGTASLVAREDSAPNTVFASCVLNSTGGIGLACLTVKPSAGTALRFSIEATNTTASVWQIDECLMQESKSVATTFVRGYIDDSTSQVIFGPKTFSGGQYTYDQGFKLYDTTGTNTTTFVASGAAGSNINLTYPAVADRLVARATTDTLTNKTIDGASNTVSDILPKVSRNNNGTDITEAASKFQSGWIAVTPGSVSKGSQAISFPVSYTNVPIVMVNFGGDTIGATSTLGSGGANVNNCYAEAISLTVSGFTIRYIGDGTWSGVNTIYFQWIAIGI